MINITIEDINNFINQYNNNKNNRNNNLIKKNIY